MVLKNSDGLHAVTGLEVTGTASSDFTLVRQWETDPEPTFGGTSTLTDLRWEEAQAGAAIYRAVCGAYAASNDGCADVGASDLTLTLAGATVIGTASEDQQGPLVFVAGDLVVSGSTLRDLDFTDPALEATGAVTLDQGTALGLGSAEQAVPAVKAGGDLQASTALFSDLSGWKSIARADQRLRVEQSYVCGVSDTDHLVEAGTFAAAEAEVVTTAVLQSRFYESLVSASTASTLTAKLANLTLLGVQTPFELPSVDLFDAESGSIEIRSLLSADSVFETGPTPPPQTSGSGAPTQSETVRARGSSPAAPSSTRHPPSPAARACCRTTASGLQGRQRPAAGGPVAGREPRRPGGGRPRGATLEEQIQALAGRLPALLPGQTDLIGTAGAWNGAREWKTACVGAEGRHRRLRRHRTPTQPVLPRALRALHRGHRSSGAGGRRNRRHDGTDGSASATPPLPMRRTSTTMLCLWYRQRLPVWLSGRTCGCRFSSPCGAGAAARPPGHAPPRGRLPPLCVSSGTPRDP